MKKGITLLEVLVSALILTIGGASMMMSFVVCQRLILESTHRYNSSLIINRHFEEISRREVKLDVQAYIDAWHKTKEVREISPGVPKAYYLDLRSTGIVSPTTGNNLWLITATVNWESINGTKAYTMSMITNEPG